MNKKSKKKNLKHEEEKRVETQKETGLSMGLVCLLIALYNLGGLAISFEKSFLFAISHLSVFPLLIGGSVALLTCLQWRWLRIPQIIAILCIAVVALFGDYRSGIGILLFLYAAVLLYRYGFFESHIVIKLLFFPASLFAIMLFAGGYNKDVQFHVVGGNVAAIAYIVFSIYRALRSEIKRKHDKNEFKKSLPRDEAINKIRKTKDEIEAKYPDTGALCDIIAEQCDLLVNMKAQMQERLNKS